MGIVIEDSVDTLNVYQTSRKRNAKLVELLNEDLTPKYVFSDSSSDFKKSSGNGDSELIFKTYRNNVNEKEVRDLALKTFEEGYTGRVVTDGTREIFSGPYYGNKNISNLKKLKEETEEKLKNFDVINYYNPFGKRFWKERGGLKSILESGSLLSTGSGVYDLFDGVQSFAGPFELIVGLGLGGILEFPRRVNKSYKKNKLKEINQNIEFYNNFKSNIENANIHVASPGKAQEIYSKVENSMKNLKDLGDYVDSKIDVGKINLDLLNTYNTE